MRIIFKKNNVVVPKEKVREVNVEFGGKKVETFNVIGMVKSWDGESGKLITMAGEKENTYIIVPDKTRVMVGRARNSYRENQIHVIRKSTQPMHWNSAFCRGDQVSLLLEKTTGEVVWAMDTDLRSCGFKGDF